MNQNLSKYSTLKFSFISALLTVSVTTLPAQASGYKHVAVEPDKIHEQRLATPNSKGIYSHSTMLPVFANVSKQNHSTATTQAIEIQQTISFDGQGDSPILFISPESNQWQMSVTDPNGVSVFQESATGMNQLATRQIQVGSESFSGKEYLLETPAVGSWTIKLTRQQSAQKQSASSSKDGKQPNKPAGYLMFKGDPDYKLYAHLDNNFTVQNSRVNLVAYLVNASNIHGQRSLMQQRPAMQGNIQSAYATITTPSDKTVQVKLRDDGLFGDAVAGDGQFSAQLPTSEIGTYSTQVQVKGVRPDGIQFSRTTTDLYPVAEKSFELINKPAKVKLLEGNRGIVSVRAKQMSNTPSVFMAGELWGTDANGQLQNASWLGGIVEPNSSNKLANLELHFDTRWLTRNNLSAPYVIKNLRLQDVDNHVPLSKLTSVPLQVNASFSRKALHTSAAKMAPVVSPDMLSINIASRLTESVQQSPGFETKAAGGKLMLVHGYCSNSVWNTGQFSNSVEFKDYKQNRSHDAFAKKIRDFGAQYSSFGVVAHSQGGAAALHLYAKYSSGLNNASGGRLIQSVGTPYKGTALAGNAAVLGQLFGAGCGKNTDLTYNGASNWLSTIPGWAKAQVDYYTTSFKTRWWAYDYCHLATDLLLDDPEDGTTEKWSGQLPSGVNKGHKKGWCHTTGMRDPAQYTDSGRNSTMNANAAR